MAEQMTSDEQRIALKALGVPTAAIDRALLHIGWRSGKAATVPEERQDSVKATLVFPIRIRLPWSYLCSDNRKYGAISRRGSTGTNHPLLVLQADYKQAKAQTKVMGARAMVGYEPLGMPLRFVGRVWVPDNRPHDVCNFLKCCLDALQKIVYQNDSQLHDVQMIRAGVDVDQPRAEIEIRPL